MELVALRHHERSLEQEWVVCLGVMMMMLPSMAVCLAGSSHLGCRAGASFMKLTLPGPEQVHMNENDMGGFLLVSPDCRSFPVTAKQIHWLVTHE